MKRSAQQIGMEKNQNWLSVGRAPFTLYGSTCCILDKTVYVIGGTDRSNDAQCIIRVSTFDIRQLQWDSRIINGSHAVNRAFHASAVCGSKILTFGGETSLGNIGEVIEIRSTSEEVTCTTFEMNNLCVKGLSASTVGQQSTAERVILFGGINSRGEYVNETHVYAPANELQGNQMTPLQTESEIPHPRAFHSATVCGENKQYLIIHGGQGRSGLLSDIWVLDSSNLFLPPSETLQNDPKAKNSKGGKGVAPLLPFWCQVSISTPSLPRCLHSCYATFTGRSLSLLVFGGLSENGILSLSLSKTEILQEAPNKYCEHVASFQDAQVNSKRHSFCSCEIIEKGNPVAILVFGGTTASDDTNGLPQLMIINENSDFVATTAVLRELSSARDVQVDENIKHIEYPSGDVYDGEVLNEDDAVYRHGNGKLLYANGSTYEGTWEKDIRQGSGCYQSADANEIYIGQLENGEYCGEGKLKLVQQDGANQKRTDYEGNFEFSLYHGKGILKDSLSGTTYQGEFRQGLKHGRGLLTRTSNGAVLYDGDWANDIPCGYGTFMLEGGHIYTGYMQNGLPNGEGHCRYIDGSEYSGSWKSGKRNGFGTYIGAYLDEYNGKWVGDQRCGKGTWKSVRGDIYDGIWDHDLPHGGGKVTYKLGDNCHDPTRELMYEGNWDHGRRSGLGEVTYANGVTKKGSWNATTKDIAFLDEQSINS